MSQTLSGIIPPLITPLSDRDTLDAEGLERLIEHLISGGVSGLFILGTTGEGPSLSYRLRRELIETTCQLTNGRVPVLVGITDTSFTESVNLAKYSADAGATHVVTAPPYYFPAAPPELLEYVQDLVAEMPLPLFLYNMPGLTKVSFEIDLVRRALDMPGICGVKDSSCDMIYFHRLIEVAKQRGDWSVLVGPEELTAEAVLLGGHGGFVATHEAIKGGIRRDERALIRGDGLRGFLGGDLGLKQPHVFGNAFQALDHGGNGFGPGHLAQCSG